jgi:L-glyceraldehyde 3-phosphate reductase
MTRSLIVAAGAAGARSAGISNYQPQQTRRAAQILRDLGTPCLIHQDSYSMFKRWIEDGLLDALEKEGMGCICFSPLAQGLVTDKYLHDIPADSRAAKPGTFFAARTGHGRQTGQGARGQTMAQVALAWILRHKGVTSALVGASKVSQIEDSVGALDNLAFEDEELQAIEAILIAG